MMPAFTPDRTVNPLEHDPAEGLPGRMLRHVPVPICLLLHWFSPSLTFSPFILVPLDHPSLKWARNGGEIYHESENFFGICGNGARMPGMSSRPEKNPRDEVTRL